MQMSEKSSDTIDQAYNVINAGFVQSKVDRN